jgi:peptidoglycan/xylan/chitin deacetylase (PgdA/CDA1 family)
MLACASFSSAPPAISTADNAIATPAEPPTEVTLTRLTDTLWLHTSTREQEGVGRFPSHGLLVERPGGGLLIDSAWGSAATVELLEQIERELGQLPRAAIVSDFHDDRAGGTAALEAAGVEVWSSPGIIARLIAASEPAPAHALELTQASWSGTLADVDVEVWFPGAGHSPENLVVWLPDQRVLFGGCLLRAYESRGLGNLDDADLGAWAPTLRAVRERVADADSKPGHEASGAGRARVELVVPSHGDVGGPALIDHSLALVEIGLAARARERGETVPTKMAITVDDLPTHGPLPRGVTRAQVHARLLESFARHGVPEVRGYVIGEHALGSADHRDALQLWLDAGHPLGNHTWSHPNMEEIGVDAYLADIDRNERVLAELTGDASGASWRSFRYPYLRQGFDEVSSRRVRDHLAQGGYQIAEVSIDFWDWDYQAPYVRCLDAPRTSARSGQAAAELGLAALRRTYLERATEMLDWHRAAAIDAFGRPISHVLLLHGGVFTAEMLDELLDAYEARGVVWVTLDEALADPVYRDVPLPPRTHGDVLVEQAVVSLGVDHPPWTRHPGALLGALCR